METNELFTSESTLSQTNWEVLRGTRLYATEPYTPEETIRWINFAGLPPMVEGELDHQYAQRIAAMRESQGSDDGQ